MVEHEILEELGRGAMGSVHRARHTALGREVALKLIDPSLCANEHARARFHREVKLLSELSHPNIVRIFDSGVLDERPYFTMEILAGADLAQLQADRGPVPIDELVPWIAAAADALAYLHQRGHTHRDVKPSNLMLTDEGRVVLTDFGLVHVDGATVLTRTGELAGTPRYLAPEMLTGAPPSPAQDVWALALTAHELALGRSWVGAISLRELVAIITHGDVPGLDTLRADVPPWFVDAQRRALARDPAARLSAAAYRDLLTAGGAGARRPLRAASEAGKPHPRSRPVPLPAPPRSGATSILSGATAAPGAARSLSLAAVVGVLSAALLFALARGPRAMPATLAARVQPPDGLVVELADAPPPGARLVCASPLGLLATRDVTARALELVHLPADTALTLTLSGPDGTPLARPLALTTPARAWFDSFHAQPCDTWASVAFRATRPTSAVVELGTWTPRRVVTTVPTTVGPAPFVQTFTGLSPDSDYFVRVTPRAQFGGVSDYRFRTWTRRWGESYRRISRHLTPQNVDESAVLLDETPEADAAREVCRALEGVNLERLAGIRHIAWLARDTLNRCLVDRLIPALEQDIAENSKGVVLIAAWEVGHADAIRLCERALPRLTENFARESAAHVIAQRGPIAFDALVAEYQRHPEQGGMLQSLPYADANRAREFFAAWLERPWPARDDQPLRCVFAAIARGRVPGAAPLLARALERNPPEWVARHAVDALVSLGDAASRDVLAAAFTRAPDSDVLETGVVRAGAAAARPALVARLADRLPAPALRRAAFALGALVFGTTPLEPAERVALQAALAAPDATVASAAAWALGQVADAPSADALAARAGGPDTDPEGFAAWALARATAGPDRAAPLLARLAREPGDTAAALTRKALVAEAAVRLGAPPDRVLAALGPNPPPVLRQAVDGPPPDRDVGPVVLAVDLFPQLPALRLPLALGAGASCDLRANGWLALPGGQLKVAAAAQDESPAPDSGALAPSLTAGVQHARLKSQYDRVLLASDCDLDLSCYLPRDGPRRTRALDGAAGWVRVQLCR